MPRTLMPTPDLPQPHLPDPGLAAHLPTLRAMLEEQRRFRIEQLVDLAGAGHCTREDDARREVASTLTTGARRALADIEAALARMRTGRYGVCLGCDEPIGADRLSVIPQAALCVECQRRTEG